MDKTFSKTISETADSINNLSLWKRIKLNHKLVGKRIKSNHKLTKEDIAPIIKATVDENYLRQLDYASFRYILEDTR